MKLYNVDEKTNIYFNIYIPVLVGVTGVPNQIVVHVRLRNEISYW